MRIMGVIVDGYVLDFDCFSSKKLIDQPVSWRFNASLLGRSSKPQ